jgi:hypothetical protein
MSNQSILEDAIRQLGSEFAQDPYRYFTEADAVARFHQILDSGGVNSTVNTSDGFAVPQIHREYPTFFRFSDKNPVERLPAESKARRGHYDTVILNPEFIQSHPVETVTNRSIKTERNKQITPFKAVVEFKLYTIGWSAGRAKGAIAELGKLQLSNEAPLRYFVVFMRYTASTMTRWNRYWPMVLQEANNNKNIGSYFVIRWLSLAKKGSEEFYCGSWLNKSF